MNKTIYPAKLKNGDHLRIIAPARSMAIISEANRSLARARLENLGFKISLGKHVDQRDIFDSSSVQSRLEDIHDAFADKSVNAVITVIGGYNTNQLLQYLDYELIQRNPKILCGFSDITALSHAIFAKTGLVTYSGPHFSSWSMIEGFEYTEKYFKKALMSESAYIIQPSEVWSDDQWYLDQENRDLVPNPGYWIINEGESEGRIVGAHTRSLAVLQGTEYWPGFEDSVLFMEEDAETHLPIFDRLLQSFMHLHDFRGVKGIVIGRFQKQSGVREDVLKQMIKSRKELQHIPVIANVDFGHTNPIITFPIGGQISLKVNGKSITLEVLKH